MKEIVLQPESHSARKFVPISPEYTGLSRERRLFMLKETIEKLAALLGVLHLKVVDDLRS